MAQKATGRVDVRRGRGDNSLDEDADVRRAAREAPSCVGEGGAELRRFAFDNNVYVERVHSLGANK